MKAFVSEVPIHVLLEQEADILSTPKQITWTSDVILEKISTDVKWLIRGLLALYQRQTESEKSTATTDASNKMGFSVFDAELLSSFAKQVLNGDTLSQRQIDVIRRRLPKYVNQLTKIANKEL
jgi:hypothetical protein